MKTVLKKSHALLIRVLPFVVIIVLAKLVFHKYGLEFISLNSIFSGIIGANVFLLGFLLSGVLSDYKESEKLPGEMASILMTIADELDASYRLRNDSKFKEGLHDCLELILQVKSWLFKKITTRELTRKISGLYQYISQLEGLIAPNYIARLKQEQHNLRKLIIRIHTIRETNFISSGYLIATTTTFLLLSGLVLTKIKPFFESLFFVGVISYLMIFLIFLIRDLDNPFGYYEGNSSEDVSLKPIDEALEDVKYKIEVMETGYKESPTDK